MQQTPSEVQGLIRRHGQAASGMIFSNGKCIGTLPQIPACIPASRLALLIPWHVAPRCGKWTRYASLPAPTSRRTPTRSPRASSPADSPCLASCYALVVHIPRPTSSPMCLLSEVGDGAPRAASRMSSELAELCDFSRVSSVLCGGRRPASPRVLIELLHPDHRRTTLGWRISS